VCPKAGAFWNRFWERRLGPELRQNTLPEDSEAISIVISLYRFARSEFGARLLGKTLLNVRLLRERDRLPLDR
jgi:hypothetical protein